MPTFQRETRATLERLDTFQANTKPLIDDLVPVARDLSPTLASVRELSPNLRDLFIKLGDLQEVAQTGLPAARSFLTASAPVLDQLDPFLANLNPVLRYLEFQKATVVDFLMAPGVALSGKYVGQPGDPAPRHGLRQIGYIGTPEALSIYPTRLAPEPRQRLPACPARSTTSARPRTGSSPTSTARTPTTARAARPRRGRDPPRPERPGHQQRQPARHRSAAVRTVLHPGRLPRTAGDDFGAGRFPGLFQDP